MDVVCEQGLYMTDGGDSWWCATWMRWDKVVAQCGDDDLMKLVESLWNRIEWSFVDDAIANDVLY